MRPISAREERRRWPRWRCGAAVALFVLAATGCDSLLKNDQLPPNVTDPAITETPQGALTAYYGTVELARSAYAGAEGNGVITQSSQVSAFVVVTGLISDELGNYNGVPGPEDLRAMPETPSASYSTAFVGLQRVRGMAGQALGLLADFRPDQPELAAHVYALEGYAEIFLAELYCSGIPLSTLDYKGDYTLKPGSTTDEVLTHAVALFDSALALAGDSVKFQRLAQVGKARALLALGQYAAAASAVNDVPDAYAYAFRFDSASGALNFGRAALGSVPVWQDGLSVADPEGINGLNYGTSGDPRTAVTNIGTSTPIWHPNKYLVNGASPVVLASGIEARLIEAEAELEAGSGTWLTTLNALRTDGTYDTTATSPPDTLWHAGTGGVPGLAPLSDPGSTDSRVDLLFRERAFWLFLTGHRQGDLRRLIRQYGRTQDQVYPVGVTAGGLFYGNDVTEPVPYTETQSNALYHGCFSRDA